MGNEMFQARLNDDFAERIHEFRDEQYMSKSEAVRHLLRTGLEAETDDEQTELEEAVEDATQEATEDTKPIADGGAIMRPTLRLMAGITLSLGVLSFMTLYVAGVMMDLSLPAADLLGFMFSSFLTGAIFFLPTMTRYPERIDRRLWNFSGRVRKVVAA